MVLSVAYRRAGKFDKSIKESLKVKAALKILSYENAANTSGKIDSESKKPINAIDLNALLSQLPPLAPVSPNISEPGTRVPSPRGEMTENLGVDAGGAILRHPVSREDSAGGETMNTSGKNRQSTTTCLKVEVASPTVLRKIYGKHEKTEMNLNHYKMKFGLEDVHQKVFEKLSDIQDALVTPPLRRNIVEIEIIATKLRLFSLLRGLSDEDVYKMAAVIEYRPVQSKQSLYKQNGEADGVCFLLKGHIQVKIDLPFNMAPLPAVIDYFDEGVIGHLDCLFHSNCPVKIDDYIKLDENIDQVSPNGEDDDPDKYVHRSLVPMWFSSYNIQAQSEILLLPREHFNLLLAETSVKNLKLRYDAISACGIFTSWPKLERLRAARMGYVRSYKSGDIIIEQVTILINN